MPQAMKNTSEAETLRMIRRLYGAFFISAAAHFQHRPEILAGICMRESAGGNSPLLDKQGPEGRGDGGHGYGLMQIDDRSFPEFCKGTLWMDAYENIKFGAWVLARKRRYLSSQTLGYALTTADLERAAVAAYNAGEVRVLKLIQQHEDVDLMTANKNYSAEVLRLAEIYRSLGEL